MKIRILDNSLRLRLSQTEVRQLDESGIVRCSIQFSPATQLHYSVKSSSKEQLYTTFDSDEIIVHVPISQVHTWANSDEISLLGEAPISPQASLKMLVEKDFKCGDVRDGEDESDLFPNPNEQDSYC